jgi:hypothetical protein
MRRMPGPGMLRDAVTLGGLRSRERQHVFSHIALATFSAFTLTSQGGPEQLGALSESKEMLPALGLAPKPSRKFSARRYTIIDVLPEEAGAFRLNQLQVDAVVWVEIRNGNSAGRDGWASSPHASRRRATRIDPSIALRMD